MTLSLNTISSSYLISLSPSIFLLFKFLPVVCTVFKYHIRFLHAFFLNSIFFQSSPQDMFLLILEREERWKREKYPLVASCTCPDQGSNPRLRYVPWWGINLATFWCMGWCSNQVSHSARAQLSFQFILPLLYHSGLPKACSYVILIHFLSFKCIYHLSTYHPSSINQSIYYLSCIIYLSQNLNSKNKMSINQICCPFPLSSPMSHLLDSTLVLPNLWINPCHKELSDFWKKSRAGLASVFSLCCAYSFSVLSFCLVLYYTQLL